MSCARSGVALALSAAVLWACTPPAPPPPTITLTASATSVLADGTSSVTIDVAHTSDVRLSTGRGRFQPGGMTSTVIAGGTGSAVLVTCDSRLPAACAGDVRVNAVGLSDEASGSITITFTSLETCSNGRDDDTDSLADCADPDCVGVVCRLQGAVSYNCTSAGACLCAVDGGTPELSETVCNDGLDNDCDGQSDCADTKCMGQACLLASGNMGSCNASRMCTCPGTAEGGDNASCSDGIDNDCDGLLDCQEPGCQAVGNQPGRICRFFGHTTSVGELTCSSGFSDGGSTCSVCTVPNGIVEQAEGQTVGGATAVCGDGKDNDCDGPIDCADADCLGRRCSATGSTCNASMQCTCPGGAVETDCADNNDNDCDGQIDCADTDCRSGSQTCGPNGRTCTSSGSCACSGNGGAAETNETSCGDRFDNDCDGQVDCIDQNCRATAPTFTNGRSCDFGGSAGLKCDGAGSCYCPTSAFLLDGGLAPEATCNDNTDNDCDGLIDCQDPNCAGLQCNTTGRICPTTFATGNTCNVCTGNGGTVESPEVTCNDLRDNDCDGLIDCDDTDCGGLQCGVAANYQCTSTTPRVCRDVSSNFSLQLAASPTRIAANGAATSSVTATLRNMTTPMAAQTVTFSVPTSNGSTAPSAGTTNGSGVVGTTFTSGANGGNATVEAAYDAGTQVIFGTVTIDQPRLGSIVLTNQQVSVMGVRFSSFNETNQLTFSVRDQLNNAYPPGLTVTFEHAPQGGSNLGNATNCTSSLCTETAVTDALGQVRITLRSGTVASIVYVRASATAGGVSAETTAQNIAIVGAKASGTQVSIICTPQNVPGLSSQDCSKSLYSGAQNVITCTSYFADRFQNILGRQTLTTYSTEAGAASPPSFTNNGQSSGTVNVTGYALPADVPPLAGEYSLTHDDGCGPRVHNPRDGLVTIIVSANGEEGFIDGSNGRPADGVYQAGENFLDLPEPFVDWNDNNVRDLQEPYVDSDNDGTWDGPNGVWDSDTTVWASTRVLYSGRAYLAGAAGGNGYSRWYNLSSSPQPPDPTAALATRELYRPDAGAPETESLGVYFADVNFNPVSFRATYALTVTPSALSANFTVNPTATVDGLGLAFTQQFCADQAGTAGCGTQCNAAPCYRVGVVNGFSNGRRGEVLLRAGMNPVTAIQVRASCTLESVTTNIDVNANVH